MHELTKNARRALEILNNVKGPYYGMTARAFSYSYFEGTPYEYLLTAHSKQGNGSCHGKKAWLCAGSYLKRLCNKGLVKDIYIKNVGWRYQITQKGRDLLKNKSEQP